MEWLYLLLAGVMETCGVSMMNRWHQSRHWTALLWMMLSFALSFILLFLAMKDLPMGLSYAIWTGIGTAGGVLVGMIRYGESRDWKRIAFIAMILSAAAGLKLTS